MMAPPPCSTIFGAAARHVSNVVTRWPSSNSWNCALVTSRIDSLANPAVPAQFTRMSMRPNSLVHLSISASATAGSAGEPGWETARSIRVAASAAVSASRPLTTTPAPCAARCAATWNPIPREPPTTTAPRPDSEALIAAVRHGLHHAHVPVAAQVGQQARVVDLVGEDSAHRARRAVVERQAQVQDVSDLVGRTRREGLLTCDGDRGEPDAVVPKRRDAVLAAHTGAVGIGVGGADRVLDDDIVGHQRQPGSLVLGMDGGPGGLRRGQRGALLHGLLRHARLPVGVGVADHAADVATLEHV